MPFGIIVQSKHIVMKWEKIENVLEMLYFKLLKLKTESQKMNIGDINLLP